MRMKIGLYPIVDSEQWVERLLQFGVKTIQLRIKDKCLSEVDERVKKSVLLAKKYNAQLFVNDYWQIAIKYDAFGVHLGQEDIVRANILEISRSKLRLGISTHSKTEIEKALAYCPSYIAFGPVYHTDTKQMPYKPQGLERLRECCQQSPCPVVAIGGINEKRIEGVLATGVDGIAVLSAIVKANNVEFTVNDFLRRMREKKC